NDVNEAPVFASTVLANDINENLDNTGWTVAATTAGATDVDTNDAPNTDFATLSYSIVAVTDDLAVDVLGAGLFAINALTGEVSITGTLDYETSTFYTVTIDVTDQAGAGLDAVTNAVLTVTVNDVNEAPV